MEKRRLGKTDMTTSVLGFGGAEIGFQNATETDVSNLLAAAIDSGLNAIDTASAYLESEMLIGRALGSRRKSIYLFTKCGSTDGFSRSDWSPRGLQEHIERSLKNLRTDYLDLIQLHSCSADLLRQGDVIAALQKARDKGYARYIGYSGDNADAVAAVKTGAFDTLQCSISILDQANLNEVLPLARECGLGMIAKRPIGNAVWYSAEPPQGDYYQEYWKRAKKLNYDFCRVGDAGSISRALRFTLSQPGVHVAIVGTRKPGRWAENANFVKEGPLSQSEIDVVRGHWSKVANASWAAQV